MSNHTETIPSRILGGFFTGETTTINPYTGKPEPEYVEAPPKEAIDLAVDVFMQLMADQDVSKIEGMAVQSLWIQLAKKVALSGLELENFRENLTRRCLLHSAFGCKIESDYKPVGLLADAVEDTRPGAGSSLAIVPSKTSVYISTYLPDGGISKDYNVITKGRVIARGFAPVRRRSICAAVTYGSSRSWVMLTGTEKP
jgi:hypothetical protein